MVRAQPNHLHRSMKARHAPGTITAEPVHGDMLAVIAGMGSLTEADRVCRTLCNSLGFDYYLFYMSLPVACERPARIVLNQLPEAWQEHYDKVGYGSRDPVLEQACRSSLPFFWDEIERQSRDSQEFFTAARGFGIGCGVTFPFSAPLNTFAVLSFANREAFAPEEPRRHDLVGRAMWLVANFHEVVRRLALRSSGIETSARTRLTRRERECLALSGTGYTTSQIATRLKIAPRTVAFHIDRSVTKLGVHSRRAALTRAMALGEVDTRIFSELPLGVGRNGPVAVVQGAIQETDHC